MQHVIYCSQIIKKECTLVHSRAVKTSQAQTRHALSACTEMRINMTQNHSPKTGGKLPCRNQLLKQAGPPFLFLLALALICGFLARYLTDSETLSEYARNNPEAAYGSTQEAGTDTTTVDDSISAEETGGSQNTDKTGDEAKTGNEAKTVPAKNEDTTSESAYTKQEESKEQTDMTDNPDRITYQPGFSYEPLDDTIKARITGISYPETGCTVPYEDLRYVRVTYLDFDGKEQDGELICNKEIAQDMVEIFYELYQNDYQIEQIRLIDEYDGDDTLSMMENNTSCFNYRVVDGTTSLSKHAYGLAIDINPFYNPYVVFNKNGTGETYISPAGSEIYADRSQSFAYKIDESDLCYRLFKEHGFTWGGDWNSCKDYQHFQKAID